MDPSTVNLNDRAKSIDEVKVNRGKKIRDYTEKLNGQKYNKQNYRKTILFSDEEMRQINLKNVDEAAFQKYDKIHKLMLTNVYQ